jgi:hypothetical protein
MSIKENSLVTITETDFGASDYVRVLESGSSRKITTTNFADALDPLLVTLGFLKSAAAAIVENRKVLTKNTNYNLVVTDSVLLIDTSAGDVGINLLTSVSAWDATTSAGQQFTIKKITTDVNKVTVTPAGVETIDGNTSYDLLGPNLTSITFISDGSNWHVLS